MPQHAVPSPTHLQGRTFPVEQLFLEDCYEATGGCTLTALGCSGCTDCPQLSCMQGALADCWAPAPVMPCARCPPRLDGRNYVIGCSSPRFLLSQFPIHVVQHMCWMRTHRRPCAHTGTAAPSAASRPLPARKI